MIYRFERQARRPQTILLLSGIWAVVLALWIAIDVTPWIAGLAVLCTLPALIDVIRNATAVLEVWPSRVVWTSGLRNGDRSDIDHVRLNRRFDGSMKITLIHVGGSHTRLPPDITPPTDDLEHALDAAGIPTQRHPFSFL